LLLAGGIVKAHVTETKLKIEVKSKPEIIIEISPDTHEVMKERSASRKKERRMFTFYEESSSFKFSAYWS